jgi:Kef-type K+ transport system membrane component KefB
MMFLTSSPQGMLPSPPLIWVTIAQCFIGVALLAISAILDITSSAHNFGWSVVSMLLHLGGIYALASFAEMLSRRLINVRVHDSKTRKVIRCSVMITLFILTFSTMTFVADIYARRMVS